MTTKPTGGQAFPTGMETHPSGNVVQWPEPGMTLRQWYAGQALASGFAPAGDPTDRARWAFVQADAMIAEGEKPAETADNSEVKSGFTTDAGAPASGASFYGAQPMRSK